MDEIITLDYGSGGKKTSELIDNLIVKNLKNDALSALGDGAVLSGAERLVFSTDSFVVSPIFFPGGDIGKLSVCGNNRPIVAKNAHVVRSCVDHRLYRQRHSRIKSDASARLTEIRYFRFFVKILANAVPRIFPYNAEAI